MSSAEADRLKRHREEMQRAVADGVSLAEARDRLARDRHRAAQSLLEAKRTGSGGKPRIVPSDRPQPWMMRD
ncbi:MAG: hypothetical protein ABIO86_19205 [Sphingomonas sp.]